MVFGQGGDHTAPCKPVFSNPASVPGILSGMSLLQQLGHALGDKNTRSILL